MTPQPSSSKRETSTSPSSWSAKMVQPSLIPTWSTFALGFVIAMVNGSAKTGLVRTSWREKLRWNSTMGKAHSWRSTLEKWAEGTQMESWTSWSTPSRQCCSFLATIPLLRGKLTAIWSSLCWLRTSASVPRRRNDFDVLAFENRLNWYLMGVIWVSDQIQFIFIMRLVSLVLQNKKGENIIIATSPAVQARTCILYSNFIY